MVFNILMFLELKKMQSASVTLHIRAAILHDLKTLPFFHLLYGLLNICHTRYHIGMKISSTIKISTKLS